MSDRARGRPPPMGRGDDRNRGRERGRADEERRRSGEDYRSRSGHRGPTEGRWDDRAAPPRYSDYPSERRRDESQGNRDTRQRSYEPVARDSRDYRERSGSRESSNFGSRGESGYPGNGNGRGGFQNPRAPSTSEEGRKQSKDIELLANYFEVLRKPDWTLYQYNINFEPEQKSKKLCVALISQHNNLFHNNKAYDGFSMLYSITKLPQPVTEVNGVLRHDGSNVKIIIKYTATISSDSYDAIKIYNTILKRCLIRCNYQEFGRDRSYYDFENPIHLQSYFLNIISGYKASMAYYNDRLLLNAEISHKLLNSSTIWDVMEKIFRESPRDSKYICSNQLIGQIAMTNYNNKTYRIDDIAWEVKPSDTFEQNRGEPISYVDYYWKKYERRIRNVNQPLLVTRIKNNTPKKRGDIAPLNEPKTRNVFLVPELCSLTGTAMLKEFEKNFKMRKDIDSVTKQNPGVKYQRLHEFLSKLRRNNDAARELENWQIKFSDELVKINAKQLPSNDIIFRNDKRVSNTDAGWDRSMRDSHHLVAIPLNSWILFFPQRDEAKAQMFERLMQSLSQPMGFQVNRAVMYRLPDVRGPISNQFANGIRDQLAANKPQMVICIVPSNAKDTYDAIKKLCCLEYGIPSQVVTSRILDLNNQNKTKSVVTKVSIQVNCKLGGEIWGVIIPFKNIMVVGIDLYKDSSDKNLSVAAFVASVNGTQDNKLNCTKFYSKCILQQRKANYIDSLQILMHDALVKYNQVNRAPPDKIFIYRDGVGDGQFRYIEESEMPQIKRAFIQFNPNYNPKVVTLIVKKRSNTRFFFKNNNGFINAPIGSCIDKTVIKTKNEFFLVSQSSNQSTVTPTHFHVFQDEQNLIESDKIQMLTYKFTHLYYNWSGQIRVPAPCHYANKLAHLVGESLHQPHLPTLNDKLFYL